MYLYRCFGCCCGFFFLFPLFFLSFYAVFVCVCVLTTFLATGYSACFAFFSFCSLRVRIVWRIFMHGVYLGTPYTPPILFYDLWHPCVDLNSCQTIPHRTPLPKLCPEALSVTLFVFFFLITWIYIPSYPSNSTATLMSPSLPLYPCTRIYVF